jgi:hypothetical protein
MANNKASVWRLHIVAAQHELRRLRLCIPLRRVMRTPARRAPNAVGGRLARAPALVAAVPAAQPGAARGRGEIQASRVIYLRPASDKSQIGVNCILSFQYMILDRNKLY